jgi:hypothetical protein
MDQQLVVPYTYPPSYNIMPMYISPATNAQYEFYIDRYFTHVLGIQYRLADQKALRSIMSFLAQQNPAVKSSISLLSVLHIQSQARAAVTLSSGVAGLLAPPSPSAQKLYNKLYEQTRKLLQESKLFKQGRLDEGDAMACLHLISAFLFSGGRGTWYEFLGTAGDWVEAMICDYGESALLALSERGRFIFRATMWMDVFSGVSLCRPPRFLRWYQQLFRPGATTTGALPDDLGMERIMGCPNDVILAFAETAQLEHDKQCESTPIAAAAAAAAASTVTADDHTRCGAGVEADIMLQYMLRSRGMQIEAYIPEVAGPAMLPSWERFVELKDAEDGSTDAEHADREIRTKVAEVFKQGARVYLHSVVEGCDPQIPTIRRAVVASILALTVRGSSFLSSVGSITEFACAFSSFFLFYQKKKNRHYSPPLSTALSFSPSPSPAAWPRHRPRSSSASPASQMSATTPTRLATACRRASSSARSGRSALLSASTHTVCPSSRGPSTGASSCASWVRIRSSWSEPRPPPSRAFSPTRLPDTDWIRTDSVRVIYYSPLPSWAASEGATPKEGRRGRRRKVKKRK